MEVKTQVLALQVVHTINALLAHQVLGGFGVIAVIALSTIGIAKIANFENAEQQEGYLMWSGIVEFLLATSVFLPFLNGRTCCQLQTVTVLIIFTR